MNEAVITSEASNASDPNVEFLARPNATQLGLAWSSNTPLEELGLHVRAKVRTDSQVVRSVVLTQGLRKMKYFESRFLFVQEVDESRRDLDFRHSKQAQASRLVHQNCRSPAFGTRQAGAWGDERQRCQC